MNRHPLDASKANASDESTMFVPLMRWVVLLGFIGVCFAAAFVGNALSGNAAQTWYPQLNQPAFTPPAWVFGPVWAVLYLAMGVAAWLVWLRRGVRSAEGVWALFALQLVLNAVWPGVFFGMRDLGSAFFVIVVLWLAIGATLLAFWRIHRLAGALFVPYLAWVTFAAVLNYSLWQMN